MTYQRKQKIETKSYFLLNPIAMSENGIFFEAYFLL